MTLAQRTAGRANALSLILAILISGAAALLIGAQIAAFAAYPFDFDEANHANGALALFLELRAGDLPGFARAFLDQGFYPPGFSWLKGLAFLLFEPSRVVARGFSVVTLFFALLLIYAVAREIDEQYGWLAGLIAVLLTLTVQSLLVTAAQVMMEAPGLLASFALLWLYLRALKRPGRGWLLGASLLLALTFLTKYTYGLIALATVSGMELSLLLTPGEGPGGQKTADPAEGSRLLAWRRMVTERWLWLFGPFALAMFLWFSSGDNAASFLSYASAQPPGQPWVTWENLLFYPRSFALHGGPSPYFALLSLAALIWSALNWRDVGVRLLLLYFLAGMALMTINLPKNPRFIATIVPAAHVLVALSFGRAAAYRHSAQRPVRRVAYAWLLLGVLAALLSLPLVLERWAAYPSLLEVEMETSPQTGAITAWLDAQLPDDGRYFLLNYSDQLSPQRLAWFWATQPAALQRGIRFPEALMPAALVPEATPENIAALREAILASDVDYVVLFEGGAWGLPFWPEYAQAMGDVLEPVARQEFQVSYYDTEGWQDNALLRRAAWEAAKAESRYTVDVEAIVYRLRRPG